LYRFCSATDSRDRARFTRSRGWRYLEFRARGLAERIALASAYHPHRRMIGAALGAAIMPQSSACTPEMRILGSHPMVRSQDAKPVVLVGKATEFDSLGCLESQKEKKLDGDILILAQFF
jgi:hypothetical protein